MISRAWADDRVAVPCKLTAIALLMVVALLFG